jgi:tetratricopeptide (TPR) repeat protein
MSLFLRGFSFLFAVSFVVFVAPFHLHSQSSSRTPQDFSQESAVIEYVHEFMRYENDGSGTREVRSRIRVQTNAGLSAAGQLVFQYNALDEELSVRSVRVVKSDGSILPVGPDAAQDLSAPVTLGAPIYTDARQKHITVPGLALGDSLEYDVAVKTKPIVPGQFWYKWSFPNNIIALDEQLELNIPKDRTIKIKSSSGLEPSISVAGDRRIYRWVTSNLRIPPPVDLFQDFRFDVVPLLEGNRPEPPPRVLFSTFQNWSEVADWYAQLEKERRIPTVEIRSKADEITRGQNNDEDKARALYDWVSRNIRYVSLSFGTGRYQPHAASEVLANRYGDCKDKTTLLEAMLEAERLRAHPVLVSLSADVDPDVPNPMQFDHVIALLEVRNNERWLDSTVGVAPFGYLFPQLRNSQALVVSQSLSTGLRKLPTDFPFPVEYRLGIEGKINAQGVLDGTVELQTRGDLEVLIRLMNDRFTQEQLTKTADTILTRTNRFLYGTPQYSDFRVANATDISEPVKARFHVVGKPVFVNASSTRAELMESVGYGLTRLLHELKLLPLNVNPDAKENSKESIELLGPRSYSLSVNLTFTDLTKSDIPPAKEFHLERSFAEFQSRDGWEDVTFHGYRSLDLRVKSISASDSDELSSFVRKITDAFPAPPKPMSDNKSASTPAKSPSTAPPAPGKHLALPEAQEMYQRGEDETKRKNWANAIDAFNSATNADPNYPDAWRELGRAHMYARQYSDAEKAFRKYLDLAPNDHLAYLNMAWCLYNEKKFEEDRDLMLKRIAAAPDDGDALFRLGVAYLALHQPAQAVPVLERSVVQFPKYVAAHLALARAYLENHEDLLAQESLRKVIAIDSSENTLNSAAYLLSEHSVFLDLAEEWSQRSIDVAEKELNNSNLSNLQSSTWALVTKVSHYWDTLGWIKFQQAKMDAAEKYVLASCQVNDEPTIDFHLGRIYEARDRKNEAIDIYLAALKAVPSNADLSDDAKEARKRVADLLGGDSQVDERLKQFHRNTAPIRTVTIANSGGEQGITQYAVMIDANSKAVEITATTPDDALAGLVPEVRAATMPQSFPDTTLKRLPRLSTLTCPASNESCVFLLMPVYAASRVAPAD